MDPLRAYTQLVTALTEVTRQRARDAGVTQVAEGAAATARAVRQVLGEVVRAEVAQSVEGLGLASSGEVDRLRRRVEALERRVDRLQRPDTGAGEAPTPADMPAVAHPPAAPEPDVRRTGTRKRSGTSTTAKSTTAKSTTGRTAKRATRKASG